MLGHKALTTKRFPTIVAQPFNHKEATEHLLCRPPVTEMFDPQIGLGRPFTCNGGSQTDASALAQALQGRAPHGAA